MFPIINKNLLILIISYLSLIIGFYFQENFAGGAKQDYELLQVSLINDGFNKGILNFLFNYYPTLSLSHSPLYYILINYLQSLFGNFYTRLIILHIFLLLPFFFLKTLNFKFKKNDLFLISIVFFFLSANYRSLAIWSGREIIVILFLILSIFYYLKFLNKKKLKNIYISFSLLIISSYFSPEVGIISLIYLYETFQIIDKKKILFIIIFNLLASIPFILYLKLYLSFEHQFTNNIHKNLIYNIPYFFSSIVIYTIPFILIRLKEYFKFILSKFYVLFFFFIFFYFLNLGVNLNIGGGGIYVVLKKINLEESLFIFSSIGFFNLIFLLEKKIYNVFILFIFILQTCLNFHFFQKYLDLYWIIYFMFFLKMNNLKLFLDNKNFTTLLVLVYCTIFLANIIVH